MACCVTGHMDAPDSKVSVEASTTPACHQTQATQSAAFENQKIPSKFCPTCDDCAVSSSDHNEPSPAITTAKDIKILAVGQISASLIPTDLSLPDSTAPPRRQTLPVDRPLFKTDSLLI